MNNIKKGRDNFDDLVIDGRNKVNAMNLDEIKIYRETLKNNINLINIGLRVKDITNGRSSYLSGKRKVWKCLLSYTKKRISIINLAANSGTSTEFGKKFVEMASKMLPGSLFQEIYGQTMLENENRNIKLDEVREFVEQAQQNDSQKGNIKIKKERMLLNKKEAMKLAEKHLEFKYK